MEQLIRNLEAAEDSLVTFRANARLSQTPDSEAEDRLIASIAHARAQIQKFNEDKNAFFEDYKTKTRIFDEKQKQEAKDFHKGWMDEGRRRGYD